MPAITDRMVGMSNINGRFQPVVGPGQEAHGVSYLGQFASAAACEAVVLRGSSCWSYTWYQPGDAQGLGNGCWCATTKYFDWSPHRAGTATSGRVWRGCGSDYDCALNGACNPSTRTCACYPGWIGAACSRLNETAAGNAAGYQKTESGANVSSWGGPVWHDAGNGTYHMFVSEMINHCGLDTWASNSRIMHAVSDTLEGPYEAREELFPPFSHEPDVKRAPDGTYAMFFTQRVPSNFTACASCTNGSTPQSCALFPAHPDTDPTKLSTSPGLNGPWSAPVTVMENTFSDANLSPLISNGSALLGLWRTFLQPNASKGYSRIHTVTASDYKNPATYRYSTSYADSPDLFNLGGPTEDPFLYTDRNGKYHALFHNMYGCMPCGGHAYSDDGEHWTYTGGDAYGDVLKQTVAGVTYDNKVNRRERPHLVFDPETNDPILLTTGVIPGWYACLVFFVVVFVVRIHDGA
ncbi:hypothetical protein DIPPA_16875 [Diplonema papillatum]|nr:hypothetical protein DIPPA_16875 [Diplonema papillatum]